jgi:putative serine protease PepD
MTEHDGRASGANGRSAGLDAAFGRPPGVESSFAPGAPPPPAPVSPPPPPAPALRRGFGRPTGVADSFDPPPGAVRDPAPEPESPWWKPDAARDPWRDARSAASLGAPPTFDEDDRPPPADEAPEPAGRRRWRLRQLSLTAALVLVLGALLAGVAGGAVGYLAASRITPALLDPNAELTQVSPQVERAPGSIADIAKRVLPTVVQVEVRSKDALGSGSGVVIDGTGYILTNNHVVSTAATAGGSIRVLFNDGSATPARIAGRDAKTDLAVLKVEKPGLRVLPLGDSASIAVGDPVIAIGSPLGLTATVTSGIVSARDRAVRLGGQNGSSGSDADPVINAIQTDAPINPGNSGGPLVDGSGALVGINSAIASVGGRQQGQPGSIGLGFAIPVNEARGIAQQLIRTGKMQHPTFGVTGRPVTDGTRDGALVERVAAGSAAAKAGIKAGDVITRLGDKPVGSQDELTVAVRSHRIGQQVPVRYVRGGRTVTVTATLQSD